MDALRAAQTWLFDLDNTLYPAAVNLFAQMDARMRAFIAAELGVDEAAADALRQRYYVEHGTTLTGLMRHHGTAPERFVAYVHDIDLSGVRANPALDAALARLPGRKIVFTNGSARHAERVLACLGVARRFEAIFD
ncbi:MAG: pyrimidine 5'-nucleotidase, partial [Alphaproteobacteria bacterium]|nr:pyrimidine 5'-nucleotidase [Alphaproteobacteria bacterium]